MKVFQILAGALLLSSPSFAVPIDCISGTLADLLSVGSDGCRVGGVVLSAFEMLSVTSGATAVDAANINVSVDASMPFSSIMNFQFTNFAAASGQFFESAIGYTISRGNRISGLALSLNQPTASGEGAALAFLDTCADGIFSGGNCSGTASTLAAFLIDGDSDLTASSVYSPALGTLSIIQRVSVEGGPNGTASLAGVSLAISQVPEPGSIALTSAGIGLLWALSQRRRK